MSAAPSPIPTSPLFMLATDWIRAANNKDYAAVSSLMADDCLSQTWPSSVQQPGHAYPEDKKAVLDGAKVMFDTLVEHMGVDVDHPVNVIEAKDTIVLQLNSHGKLKSGAPLDLEYVHIFRFNADHKIVRHDKWTDSAALLKAFATTGGAVKVDESLRAKAAGM